MKHLLALATLAAVLSPPLCEAADLLNLKITEAESGHEGMSTWRTAINIRVDEISRQQLAKWTSQHVGETIKILIDGRTVSEVRLLTPITGGVMQISGVNADEIGVLIPKLIDGHSSLSLDTSN
jgi:preprotein translocase subunit SecD